MESGGASAIRAREMETSERSRAYHRWQFRLSALSLVVSAAYLIAWIVSGAAVALRDTVSALTTAWWIQVPVILLALGIGHRLLTFPISWIGGFWLPRRYGLLHQSAPSGSGTSSRRG